MGRCTPIYYDAAKAISKMRVGTEIPHSAMSKLVKIDHSFKAYSSRVGEVRDILRTEYKLFLVSVHGSGYMIAHHDDAIAECEHQFYQGYRGMLRGVANTQYINIDAIENSEAKAATIEKIQKMSVLVGMTRSGLSAEEQKKAESTLKDIAKSVGIVKEKSLPNAAGLGEAMKICRKSSSAMTSKN